MKIQYVSDLHLDVSNIEIDASNSDVLVIAGDLSSDPSFAAMWIKKYIGSEKPVIYIPGNHEYDYRDIFYHDRKIIEALSELSNVHFLNNRSIVIDNVKFIGSCLWTGFDGFPELGSLEDLKSIAAKSVCDFYSIYNNEKPFSPDDASVLHKNSKLFLLNELSIPFDGKKVVVSHFPPSRQVVHKMYKGNLLNPYFVADAEDLLMKSDLWIHGHLHSSINKKINGVKLISNPRGYSKYFNMSENKDFNPNKIIKI